MEVYCSFQTHRDLISVKEIIVEVFAKKHIDINPYEILFEDGIFILLMKDSYFRTHEQIQFVLDSLIFLSTQLKSGFSVFKIPDLNILETHYN